jgi:hypothetical protein
MARRYGVRNVGVRDGRKLRKVVGARFEDDIHGGRYWELLSCGHLGDPIGRYASAASQRWCVECKWEAESAAPATSEAPDG